ncbi:hypothetical protein ALC57_16432, partial [Trachymyrmex cornetzi]
FYKNHIQLTLDESVHLALKTIQESDDWNVERKKRNTGSKAYNLFTYSFNKHPNWGKKYNQVFHNTFSGNETTIHGLRCEGPAKEKYADETNSKLIETGLLIRHKVPWLGYSPDGIVMNDKLESAILFELKSPKEGERMDANDFIAIHAVKSFDAHGKLRKKCTHYGQIQLGMLLLGLDYTDYVNYSSFGHNYIYERVSFDFDFVLNMIEILCSVYFDEMLPRIMKDFNDANNNNNI